jgi:hypothetical protein
VFDSRKHALYCGNVGEHHHIEMPIYDASEFSVMSRYAFSVSHLGEEEGTKDTAFHQPTSQMGF